MPSEEFSIDLKSNANEIAAGLEKLIRVLNRTTDQINKAIATTAKLAESSSKAADRIEKQTERLGASVESLVEKLNKTTKASARSVRATVKQKTSFFQLARQVLVLDSLYGRFGRTIFGLVKSKVRLRTVVLAVGVAFRLFGVNTRFISVGLTKLASTLKRVRVAIAVLLSLINKLPRGIARAVTGDMGKLVIAADAVSDEYTKLTGVVEQYTESTEDQNERVNASVGLFRRFFGILGKGLLFFAKLGFVTITAAGLFKALGVNLGVVGTKFAALGRPFKAFQTLLAANLVVINKFRGVTQGFISGFTGIARAFGGTSATARLLNRELSGLQLVLSGMGRVIDETVEPLTQVDEILVQFKDGQSKVAKSTEELNKLLAQGGKIADDAAGSSAGFASRLRGTKKTLDDTGGAIDDVTKALGEQSFAVRLANAAWALKTLTLGLWLVGAAAAIKMVGQLTTAVGQSLFRSAVQAAEGFSFLRKASTVLTVGLTVFNKASEDSKLQLEELRRLVGQTAEDFRQSRIELELVTGRLLEFAGSIGISSEQVKGLLKFTAALAAATGRDLGEAFTEVQSVILNGSNALADFGIIVSEATLVEEGFLDTTKKAIVDFTAKEKSLARVNAVLSRAKFAEAIAAETTRTFSGEIRGLIKALEDLGKESGKGAEAVFRPFASALRQITILIQGIPGFIATFLGGIKALFGPLLLLIGFVISLVGKLILLRGVFLLVKAAAGVLANLFPTLSLALLGMDAAAVKAASSFKILSSAMRISAVSTTQAITATFTKTNFKLVLAQIGKGLALVAQRFATLAISAAPAIIVVTILTAVAVAAGKVIKRFLEISGVLDFLDQAFREFKAGFDLVFGPVLDDMVSFGDIVDIVIAGIILGFVGLSLALTKVKNTVSSAIQGIQAIFKELQATGIELSAAFQEKLVKALDKVILTVLRSKRVWLEIKQVLKEDVTGEITRNIVEINKQIEALEKVQGQQEEFTKGTKEQAASLREQAKFLRMIPPAFQAEQEAMEAAVAEIFNRVEAGEKFADVVNEVLGLRAKQVEIAQKEANAEKDLIAQLTIKQQLLLNDVQGITNQVLLRERLIEITKELQQVEQDRLNEKLNAEEFTNKTLELQREEVAITERLAEVNSLLEAGFTRVAIAREGDLTLTDRAIVAQRSFGEALENVAQTLPEHAQNIIINTEGTDALTVATNQLEQALGAISDGADVSIEALRQLMATYDDLETKTKQVQEAQRLAWAETVEDIMGKVRQVGSVIENVFVKALQGQFRTTKELLSALGDAILAELTRIIIRLLVQKLIIETIEAALTGVGGGGGGSTAIPALAEGGIVRKPTLAIVGESGPEAVVPLDRINELGGGGGNVTIINTVGNPEDFVALGIARNPNVIMNSILRDGRMNGAARRFITSDAEG